MMDGDGTPEHRSAAMLALVDWMTNTASHLQVHAFGLDCERPLWARLRSPGGMDRWFVFPHAIPRLPVVLKFQRWFGQLNVAPYSLEHRRTAFGRAGHCWVCVHYYTDTCLTAATSPAASHAWRVIHHGGF